MTEHALRDTFALLDEVDRERTLPVVASHAGYRFGRQRYMLDESAVEKIAERDGVIELIFAQHQLTDGVRRGTRTLGNRWRCSSGTWSGSVRSRLTSPHGDRLRLRRLIKPTLGGLESMADMAAVERALETRYGAEDAAAICSGNALRLLRTLWRAP